MHTYTLARTADLPIPAILDNAGRFSHIQWTATCSCEWEYTSTPEQASAAALEHVDEMNTNHAMVMDML